MLQRLKDFVERPFDEEGDLLDWFLFVGLLAVFGILWTRILNAITE